MSQPSEPQKKPQFQLQPEVGVSQPPATSATVTVPQGFAQPPLAPQQQPQVPPEQIEFLNVLNKVMMAINRLAFTSQLLDEDLLQKHPALKDLRDSIKDVVTSAWEFMKLVEKLRK